MKTDQRSRYPRHFPYKHPTFGTRNRPKPESEWKKTVYYWWWAYLRRNDEYVETCKSAGRGPKSDLYKDFGDVRKEDFKSWWAENSRGAELFAEPPVEKSVRVLSTEDTVPDIRETLTVSFPLNLPKTLLVKRFKELLGERHSGRRGHQRAKKSQARFRVQGQPNVVKLELDLNIYDAVYEARKTNTKKPLWEIGGELLDKKAKYMLRETDNPHDKTEKKMKIAIIVSRHLRKAKLRIDKVGKGEFI